MNSHTHKTLFRALTERDASFEGVFYAGVKTTGIFCRPTCAAKKPLEKNVEFFSTSRDALYAGYRPCSRCHPLERVPELPEVVKKLLAVVETAPDQRLREQDLHDMDIDPSTARRQFLRHYGMTFHAYLRARRMGRALQQIKKGDSVIDTQIETGFESSSGFRAAFGKMFGTPPRDASKVDCMLAKWINTPLGAMLALANDDGLHLLEFVDRRGLENEIERLRKKQSCVIVPGPHKYLGKISIELDSYFKGELNKFTTPFVLSGSDFQLAVWNELQKIPFGTTRSYAEMSQRIGNPKAVRAMGRANGDNVLSIVVPCHRVIGADGSLTGYGGGLPRKQWLLEHERKFSPQLIRLK
ncbi:MAG: trifunctional transcriptional activator/DNA repair protein Ada/methylated-DNA--[protein]-cysteine S-methyltransferase [Burkholderiales bacterium]